MKTKEFIKKVEGLGYSVVMDGSLIVICERVFGSCVASIDEEEMYSFDIGSLLNVSSPEKHITPELFQHIVEYSSTPAEEREEEKKYYLRHRWIKSNGAPVYLNFGTLPKYYFLDNDCKDQEWAKTEFTLKEIEELKKDFDTDLSDFEMVEVEE